MEPVTEAYRPSPSLTREEMKDMQCDIAAAAVFEDRVDWELRDDTSLLVAGVDQAFVGSDTAVSGIVVKQQGVVVERASASRELEVPYIPGLLAFREGGVIIDALAELSCEPDVFLFDGSGRIHFREAGLATHIGVMFDIPAVGVAKSLLCGRLSREPDQPLEEGDCIRVEADDSVVTAESGELLGYAVQTRQFDEPSTRSINPLYVSPGHRVSASTASEAVLRFCGEYKLPDAVREADQFVASVKDEL
ncbi:MAG: endonuclease V [Candidatus Nanohaloarchaea archaeon]|nr:endonuclease V [Candidatus Nanohaloarchaea archaeon]